ncbi:hypothetical protein [Candidatus Palauibacter sp.]|uniref:hypothetical protein n=1 Tax=Candidatus Palauibacter sp. TaxID=3101350 RepID=UPI003CC605DE
MKELAARWRESADSIYRMPVTELPFFRRGRRRLYRIDDVERYEAEHMEVA